MNDEQSPAMPDVPPRSPAIFGDTRVHCYSCGRYIGPVPKCPFCGFKAPKKKSYNALKWGAVFWGVIGLLLIQQMYAHIPNPEMKIGDLGRENNYAYVTLEGVITNTPMFFPDENSATGTIYFVVDDGTGEILVKVYDDTTADLIAQNKVPAYGDRVRFQGNFQFRGYEFSIILNSADQLEITREEPIEMSIIDLQNADGSADLTSQRVTVTGYVQSWKKFDFAVDIYITDGNGSVVDIWIPQAVTDLTGNGDIFSIYEGAEVRVTGALEWYEAGSYSRWEIIPAMSEDFEMLSTGGP